MTRQTPFVMPDFWTPEACARIRAAMDVGRQHRAEIFDGDYRVDETVRNALDVEPDAGTIKFADDSLDGIRQTVASFFGMSLSASEGAGFLRYKAGHFYRAHRDGLSNEGAGADFMRRVSVVVFLSSVQGGVLRLHAADFADHVDLDPAPGLLVAFPSAVVHEVLPVESGVRDVVVDWYY